MIMRFCILLIFCLPVHRTAIAQQFTNLHFRELCDSSGTGFCAWDLSWGGKGSVTPDLLMEKPSLLIRGKTEKSVGFAEQSVTMKPAKAIQIITVSAIIKTDSVEGKGAGLNIGIYDSLDQLIATRDMGGLYSIGWLRGTQSWHNVSIAIVSPAGAAKIKIGAILYGKGKAWFRDYEVSNTPVAGRKPGKLARKFVTNAVDIIRKHSLVRDSLNIEVMASTALSIAGAAKTYTDCYLAIEYLITCLRPYGDHHSFFMKAAEVEAWKNTGSVVSTIQQTSARIIDSIGYLTVPPFHGGNPQQMLSYADSIQRAIRRLYAAGIKGWIVDLRQNTGGNMAPMIAGLGPLFSSDKLGALIDVNGKQKSWYYSDGNHFWDDEKGWSVTAPVTLPVKLPIAVLTSGRTGSSGEIVTISFIENEKTKSFGQPTWGLTTGNGSFLLKDGSQMQLASTIMADRTGKPYHGPVQPDVLIEEKNDGPDKTLAAAINWIHSSRTNN